MAKITGTNKDDNNENSIQDEVGADTISGLAGDDVIYLNGTEGNKVDGGDGWDAIFYGLNSVGIVANLKTGTVTSATGKTDHISNIEGIGGTNFADKITAAENGEKWSDLYGDDGNDTLIGSSGFDYFLGGRGADNIDGKGGLDEVGYWNSDSKQGIVANLVKHVIIDDYGHKDTVHNIEWIQGSILDDDITGNYQSNRMWTDKGKDKVRAGGGNDWIFGEDGRDRLYGEDGNDRLYGDAGTDTIVGGKGNDRLEGGLQDDVFVFQKHGGVDTINDWDYRGSADQLDVSAFHFTGKSIMNAISQVGYYVTIDLGGGDLIILRDTDKHDLSTSDFIL